MSALLYYCLLLNHSFQKRKIDWHFDEFCESLKKTEGSVTYVMNVIRDRSLKNCQDELRKVLSCGATIDLIELGNENM